MSVGAIVESGKEFERDDLGDISRQKRLELAGEARCIRDANRRVIAELRWRRVTSDLR
jgi:hypothetical protein